MTISYVSPAGYGHSTSIEDEIAEVYVRPAPEKRLCQWKEGGCATPLAQSNRESLCFRHAQLERTLKTMKKFASIGDEGAPSTHFRKTDPEPLRLCAVMECQRKLQNNNKSGRCAGHFFVQTGMQMKDGSIPKPVSIAPIAPQIDLDPLETPTTRLAGSEHSRIDGEQLPEDAPDGSGPANAEAAAKDVGQSRQEAERREGQEDTEQEEITPVSEQTTTEDPKHFRTCAVKDCDKVLGAHNKTGRCEGHAYVKRGMVMKDGTIPNPHTLLSAEMKRAKIKNAAAGTTGKNKHKPALPAPTVLPEPPAAVTDDHVSLKVPLERLDAFLMKLPVEDKVRIVERELFG